MNRFVLFLIIIIPFSYGCNSSSNNGKKEIFNKDFKWTISIPENFEAVSAEQWKIMQNKGAEAIEETYDQKIENQAKTICVFKSDQMNYFESNYQPFDENKDGSYEESFREVNKILYGTFEAQMPDAKIDSASSTETISGLLFNKFRTTIFLPNDVKMECLMYSRLFDKREFNVNIITADETKQKALLKAWTTSKFEK